MIISIIIERIFQLLKWERVMKKKPFSCVYMAKKNVLVACSSLDYILIQKTLQSDYLIDRALSKEEILELQINHQYDLLLLDIAFLKPDFKVIEGVKDTPVVALSSDPMDARDETVLKGGCSACYVKPIRQELFPAFLDYWIKAFKKA